MSAANDKENQGSVQAPDFDHEKYAEVSRSAALIDLRRFKSNFEVKPKYIGELSDPNSQLSLVFSHKVTDPTIVSSDQMFGQAKWEARAKDGNSIAVKYIAEYLVAYSIDTSLEENYLVMYFRKLAKFATYPYFRSYVAVSSADARLYIPPLPSLNDRMD